MSDCLICCRRPYERAQACESCRTRLAHTLADIHTLWTRLPEAFESGRSSTQRVSGSREAPVPVNLDALDLSGDARPGSRGPYVRGILGLDEDQTGHLAVATDLEEIAHNWRVLLCPDQHPPIPTVPELVRWLGHRADDACDRHPSLADTVAELETLKSPMRGMLGEYTPKPELCKGVPCKQCDLRALYRGEKWITCGNCGLLYSHDEYREWTRLLAADLNGIAA